MSSLAGIVWGSLKSSHLYAVFKGQYVYFGETGEVPVVRWSAHVKSSYDFLSKLRAVDIDTAEDSEPVFFVGINIADADKEPEDNRRLARRAVEAELHKRFALDPSPVGSELQLLSSSPPPPVRHKFGFDKVVAATAAYEIIAAEYQKWRAASRT